MSGAAPLRWLYHVALREAWEAQRAPGPYAPPMPDGFIHASYRDAVLESARLYFPAGSARVVLRVDPRRLTARVEVAETPRGGMPHVYGAIPREAIAEVYDLAEFERAIGGAPDLFR